MQEDRFKEEVTAWAVARIVNRIIPITRPQWGKSRDQTGEIGVQEHLVINFRCDTPHVVLTRLVRDPKM